MGDLKQAKKVDTADFLRAHTEAVEFKAVERILKVSAQTGVALHFCHVSTKQALDAINEAKKSGQKVTCEVTPNHLLLSTDYLKQVGQLAIMAPPLRDKTHLQALWSGIEAGSVDTLGSDHAPHAATEKAAASIWEVKVGVPGLETTLPLMLTLVHKNRIALAQLVSLLAEKPSEIYGLTDYGRLEQGKAAHLTIIDYGRQYKIDASKFKSKAKFSLYDGWDVWGKPVKTIVNGQVAYEEGEIVARSGSGKVLRRGGT